MGYFTFTHTLTLYIHLEDRKRYVYIFRLFISRSLYIIHMHTYIHKISYNVYFRIEKWTLNKKIIKTQFCKCVDNIFHKQDFQIQHSAMCFLFNFICSIANFMILNPYNFQESHEKAGILKHSQMAGVGYLKLIHYNACTFSTWNFII